MKRRILWVALVAGSLAVALGVTTAYGAFSDIFGSAHDVGSPGNPTCLQCHIPHDAQGDYLWAMTPSASLPGMGSLCFSCHDGAIAGQWIPGYANHPVNPGVDGQDCDRCHDAHAGDNWKFAADTLAATFRNANLCGNCHNTGSFTHPTDVLTNLPIDRTWDPDAATADFSGTRLFDSAGDAEVPTGDAYVKCATCHVAHGGHGDGMNSMTYADPSSGHAPICENCHQ
jgi:predicted CXXCH cytochrome family protein